LKLLQLMWRIGAIRTNSTGTLTIGRRAQTLTVAGPADLMMPAVPDLTTRETIELVVPSRTGEL